MNIVKQLANEDCRKLDMAEKQAKPKWRNLYFDKSGKSFQGWGLYNTEEESRIAIAEAEEWVRQWRTWQRATLETATGKMLVSDYAWAMPVPVL